MIAHGKDIERAKQAGKALADAQDIVKNDVQKALGKSRPPDEFTVKKKSFCFINF